MKPAELSEVEGHDITEHHDGHGLNESIRIECCDRLNGVPYLYEISTGPCCDVVARIRFQKGPRNNPDSIHGVTEMAVLAVVIDRLRGHQSGEYACRENAIALTKLEEAMHWMKARADNRAKRGVLGTNAK